MPYLTSSFLSSSLNYLQRIKICSNNTSPVTTTFLPFPSLLNFLKFFCVAAVSISFYPFFSHSTPASVADSSEHSCIINDPAGGQTTSPFLHLTQLTSLFSSFRHCSTYSVFHETLSFGFLCILLLFFPYYWPFSESVAG